VAGGSSLRSGVASSNLFSPPVIVAKLRNVPQMENGGRLVSKKALFKTAKIITFSALAFLPDDGSTLVGTAAGGFYLFVDREFVPDKVRSLSHILSLSLPLSLFLCLPPSYPFLPLVVRSSQSRSGFRD
jgi:hypothetical protein